MLSIIISLIIFGLIWELFNRMKSLPKLKQISRKDITPFCTEAYLKNEERISTTNAIEFDITFEFYRNLKHRDNFMQSIVKYRGKNVYIIFYHWEQNPIRKLADYFYKRR